MAAAAKSEVMKGDKLEKQDGSGSQERIMKGDKLGRQACSERKADTMTNKKGNKNGNKRKHGQRKRADASSDRPGRQMNRNAT